jgi:hypothetical protein
MNNFYQFQTFSTLAYAVQAAPFMNSPCSFLSFLFFERNQMIKKGVSVWANAADICPLIARFTMHNSRRLSTQIYTVMLIRPNLLSGKISYCQLDTKKSISAKAIAGIRPLHSISRICHKNTFVGHFFVFKCILIAVNCRFVCREICNKYKKHVPATNAPQSNKSQILQQLREFQHCSLHALLNDRLVSTNLSNLTIYFTYFNDYSIN